ncbi:MAG: ATP-dependent DNA helicase RecG [Alphaproteobacteria bacterium]
MRPTVLFPLFKDVTTLPGVGPRLGKLIAKLAGSQVVDLLWHLPSGLVDRSKRPLLKDAHDGDLVTVGVTVDAHLPPGRPRAPYRIRVRDETGFLTLVFFHARPDYLNRMLPQGESRFISGRIEDYHGSLQMTHPDYIMDAHDLDDLPLKEATYPLTAGLQPKVMAKAIHGALEQAPDLPEWHRADMLARRKWPAWRAAVRTVHPPDTQEDLDPCAPARERLAYDELLANQLALMLVRQRMTHSAGRVIEGTGVLSKEILASLPFALTGAQTRSLEEIRADMASPNRMMRLLQGDVGSGKTVVACLAMATAVEAGAQAALMAPTDILARQHFAGIDPLMMAAGVQVALLTGREKAGDRAAVLAGLESGDIQVVIGTHALFQDDVTFHDLALAVVDEQHRFGVHQRLALGEKGGGPGQRRPVDVMVMTATPIPRTLTLTAYGDMAVSRLDEKPPGRKPVTTRAVPLSRLDEVVDGLRRPLASGGQAYWVCPLVEESDVLDVTAAQERYEALMQALDPGPEGPSVGLVHGRMKNAEKDAVMAGFKAGRIKILVATTVIEVGVDVPNASIIVVEHAERFGLAQLHQLRGRVGRGTAASSCLLLYGEPVGETARARLKIMRETEDGFRIAEEDLRLRGAGDILGTRQSGLPRFRLADLEAHADLLATARDDARLLLEKDPELTGPRGEALRVLLYLHQRDEAIRFLRAG